MKIKKSLLISIACGMVAVVLSALYLHVKERQLSADGEPKRVLIAAMNIRPNTLLEPGMVRVEKLPHKFIQPNVLRDKSEVFGKVALTEIARGEQISGTKLVVGGPKTGLSTKVPEGKRAVGIELSDAEVAGGLIRPDDYVDVIVTFDYGDTEQSDKYTYTLFQNVEVLAVGSKIHSIRNPEGVAVVEKKVGEMFGSLSKPLSMGSSKKVVTLALEPNEAQQLIFAKDAGRINLVLRSPMDQKITNKILPVKVETLTGRAGFTKRFKEYRGR